MVKGLMVDAVQVEPAVAGYLEVSFEGCTGRDFVNACSPRLLEQIILAAGADYCREVHRLHESGKVEVVVES